MTRTEQQRKAYFDWLTQIVDECRRSRINLAMLVHYMTQAGYEVRLSAETVKEWLRSIKSADEAMASKTWKQLDVDERDAIFYQCRVLLGRIGVDHSRAVRKSVDKFTEDVANIAAQDGVMLRVRAGEALEKALKRTRLTDDLLHEQIIKPHLMASIAPGVRSTNDLNKPQFAQLQEAIEMLCVGVGLRAVPPFPDRNRVPVGCY